MKNWLIGIGINDYCEAQLTTLYNTLSPYKNRIKPDILEKIGTVLEDQYSFEPPCLLANENATEKAIMFKLADYAANKIKAEDTLVIFFSGLTYTDHDWKTYWLPYEAKYEENKPVIGTYISLEKKLLPFLNTLKVRQIALVIDGFGDATSTILNDNALLRSWILAQGSKQDAYMGSQFGGHFYNILKSHTSKDLAITYIAGQLKDGHNHYDVFTKPLFLTPDIQKVFSFQLTPSSFDVFQEIQTSRTTDNNKAVALCRQFLDNKKLKADDSYKILVEGLYEDCFAWQTAQVSDTSDAYSDYLYQAKTFENKGFFAQQALNKVGDKLYDDIQSWKEEDNEKTIKLCHQFLNNIQLKDSEHSSSIRDILHDVEAWQKAQTMDSIESYLTYIKQAQKFKDKSLFTTVAYNLIREKEQKNEEKERNELDNNRNRVAEFIEIVKPHITKAIAVVLVIMGSIWYFTRPPKSIVKVEDSPITEQPTVGEILPSSNNDILIKNKIKCTLVIINDSLRKTNLESSVRIRLSTDSTKFQDALNDPNGNYENSLNIFKLRTYPKCNGR